LQANNLQVSDIDMLIPHQADVFHSLSKFNLTDDQVYNNIQKYGNYCSFYSNCIDRSMGAGKIKSGDTVVLAAFGSGFTWEVPL
jgi:3-oxoacyl-[acyl-carrier-protein] synthase-3